MSVRGITTGSHDITGLTALLNQWDDLPHVLTTEDICIRVQEMLNRKNIAIFIYENNSNILGYLFAGEVMLLGIDPYIEIHSILVDIQNRGKGIGFELVQHCEQWTRQIGFNRIVLSSRIQLEKAHTFYKKMDYGVYKQSYYFHKIL